MEEGNMCEKKTKKKKKIIYTERKHGSLIRHKLNSFSPPIRSTDQIKGRRRYCIRTSSLALQRDSF